MHSKRFDLLRAKILFGAGRRAYYPVRTRATTSSQNVPNGAVMFRRFNANSLMNTLHSETTINVFGVDVEWLSKEVDSGNFFRRDLPSVGKNKQHK